jgi:hypothetical protein
MEKILSKAVFAGLCLLFTSAGADAYLVSVDFTARVSSITDNSGYLTGHIGVSDVFSGKYSYETETPDTNSLSEVGDYRHTSSPYGVSFDINGYGFRTNPHEVDFLLELGNDRDTADYDFYLFHRYNNLFDLAVPPLPAFPEIPPRNTVSFYLRDSTGNVLTSTEIPLQAPVLENWPGPNYMNISSESGVYGGEFFYYIRAELLSVTPSAPVPEPCTMLLFASGIAGLLGYRRKSRRQ